jgi:hypothetical protein
MSNVSKFDLALLILAMKLRGGGALSAPPPLNFIAGLSNVPKFDLRGANIGNLAETIQDDQIAHLQTASERNLEMLLTDYKQFIQQLQRKYPTLADATTVPKNY